MLLAATSFVVATQMAGAATVDGLSSSLKLAQDQGVTDAAQVIDFTVHLKLPNRALFEQTVNALYTPGSPTFHRWLSDVDMKQFAPPASQLATVRRTLESQGLTVTSVSKNGFSLHVQGRIDTISRAFNTSFHQFTRNGVSFRSNVTTPTISGPASAYVDMISGLQSHVVRPTISRALDVATRKPHAGVPLSKVADLGGLSAMITNQPFGFPVSVTYTKPGTPLPTATFTGITYNLTETVTPDYLPKDVQSIYGLDQAYKQGLDGTGQTIVLVEAFGYPTAQSDANAFFAMTGLPLLTSSNFSVVYPEGMPPNPKAGILTGWDREIALDIQWAHAAAPGAKIVVVATNGQDDEDFRLSMQYVIDNRLGYSVSDSWESDVDDFAGPSEQEAFDYVLEDAAAKGISFQFSTGDSGVSGVGSSIGAAGVPSAAPHATAVGGTSIGNYPGTSQYIPVGWSTVFNFVDVSGPVDPPNSYLFGFGGGGGGSSVFWPKPSWQKALPGAYRQTPDVSALADPYTGVPVVVTDSYNNTQVIEVGTGGTSLACPIFSAIWAIANQKAGHTLGQAAPTIAGLKTGILDVTPQSSPYSIAASLTDANGTTNYSTGDLFAPANPSNQPVVGALYDVPEYNEGIAVGFSLGGSLTLAKGWDNMTGYGTPYGVEFINAAASYK